MARTQKIIAACIQQACTADTEHNLNQSILGIEKAASRGAQLVVLPELHRSLYFCQQQSSHWFDLAETIPGPTTDRLSKVCQKHRLVVVASIFEKRSPTIFHNTAAVIDADGSLAGLYRKMHIPQDPGFEEKFYFTPGDLGFKPVQTSIGRLGVLICWDQWFPEAARIMALAGANCLIYPTAIGWTPSDQELVKVQQQDAWQVIQRAHSIANHLPLICCNRIGVESLSALNGPIHFWGHSFITDHQGKITAQASDDSAEILISELDFAAGEQASRLWPFFRDRRTDAYSELLNHPQPMPPGEDC